MFYLVMYISTVSFIMYICIMELRIKEIQKKKSITNVELSKRSGIGTQQISYYHSGDRTPPIKTLKKLADALECEVAELMPLGLDYYHSYNSDGEWEGIVKKK
ncbi:helix-turn-helix transcriptional regulator [uncultured Chryseobacterium sp.]|uniref:helix-turn-helix domain-containing protein n=1 Tax=uncultured Chryseobacterium sp. TaxID=259322 RepID=UPI0025EB1F6A|nr:helix-turn-helix transcriptional regulator [uncultured Chryseobacterium sp.]